MVFGTVTDYGNAQEQGTRSRCGHLDHREGFACRAVRAPRGSECSGHRGCRGGGALRGAPSPGTRGRVEGGGVRRRMGGGATGAGQD